jgi:hypothetical protein
MILKREQFETFDRLAPNLAYEDVRASSGRAPAFDSALITLVSIDDVLAENFGPRGIYVLDDRSVGNVLESAGWPLAPETDLRLIHFELNVAQLIFRFAAARKFRVADSQVKQLRINSWGRRYCDTQLAASGEQQRTVLRGAVREIIGARLSVYRELAELLRREITEEVAQRIIELNAELQVKLVS